MSEETIIKPRTRRAIAKAIQSTRNCGLDWPTLDLIHRAASLHGADADSVACAFGYMPAIESAVAEQMGLPPQRDWYLNAREWRTEDERVGVLPNAESVVLFSEFLQLTGCRVQFLTLAMIPQLWPNEAAAGGDRAAVNAAHSPSGG